MFEIEAVLTDNNVFYKLMVHPNTSVFNIKDELTKIDPNLVNAAQLSLSVTISGKEEADTANVDELNLKDGSKVYIRQLGPLISWKFARTMEYVGPLVLYFITSKYLQRFYDNKYESLSTYVRHHLKSFCWTIHYIKRLLEVVFVSRYNRIKVPFVKFFINCGYYWGFTIYVAYDLNHPLYSPPSNSIYFLGLFIFILCELGNLSTQLLVSKTQITDNTTPKIPVPNSNPFTKLFNYVSCPNYTYEFGAWLGFSIMTRCFPALLFALVGFYKMARWAIIEHNNYKRVSSNYPSGRKAIIPFLI